jgi:hypothetical protein
MGTPKRKVVAGTLALMILKTLETVEFAWRDLRFSCRLLRRQPLFAAAAIVTVALGVGANTAVVSVLKTVLLNPLGLRQADRVMASCNSSHSICFTPRRRVWSSARCNR